MNSTIQVVSSTRRQYVLYVGEGKAYTAPTASTDTDLNDLVGSVKSRIFALENPPPNVVPELDTLKILKDWLAIMTTPLLEETKKKGIDWDKILGKNNKAETTK